MARNIWIKVANNTNTLFIFQTELKLKVYKLVIEDIDLKNQHGGIDFFFFVTFIINY